MASSSLDTWSHGHSNYSESPFSFSLRRTYKGLFGEHLGKKRKLSAPSPTELYATPNLVKISIRSSSWPTENYKVGKITCGLLPRRAPRYLYVENPRCNEYPDDVLGSKTEVCLQWKILKRIYEISPYCRQTALKSLWVHICLVKVNSLIGTTANCVICNGLPIRRFCLEKLHFARRLCPCLWWYHIKNPVWSYFFILLGCWDYIATLHLKPLNTAKTRQILCMVSWKLNFTACGSVNLAYNCHAYRNASISLIKFCRNTINTIFLGAGLGMTGYLASSWKMLVQWLQLISRHFNVLLHC